jgi:xanthine dehydrogenase accessory factor
MCETKCLLDAVARLRRDEEPFLVATVVRVRGSAYRRPGARMLLTRDRWIAGSVSGGCLEGDVVRKGWWRTRDGAPRIVTYDATARDEAGWGFGLGCDGIVDVLLERADQLGQIDPFGFLEACVSTQQRGVLATALGGDGVAVGKRVAVRADGHVESDIADAGTRQVVEMECREALATNETRVATLRPGGRAMDVLFEAVRPPLRLFVLGTGHDAVPLVECARSLGWEAIVCEPRARLATRERFGVAGSAFLAGDEEIVACIDASDRAAAVVMAHDYERDRAVLRMLLASRVEYIGALGPKRRTLRMLAELGVEDEDPRLHAPVGLELGAETPSEIALAIAAEVQAALHGRSGANLRERCTSIHSMRAEAAE